MRWVVLGVVLLAGCAAAPQRPAAPLPASAPQTVEGLVAAIQADSARSDHESDGAVRAQLADEANRYADACLAQAPQAAACLYGRGVALGLAARAHPLSAGDLLKKMLDSLNQADAADPNYDQAGPSRVKALVLVRAPGWPVGPGDADSGLVAARRAVQLKPDYPPNQLALAEALAKTGDADGARAAYTRALDEARAMPAGADWVKEAEEGLAKH